MHMYIYGVYISVRGVCVRKYVTDLKAIGCTKIKCSVVAINNDYLKADSQ